MSRKSHDVILRFQGFKNLQEKNQIGGILASFVTGILESADNPKEAAHFCQYFLRERLSREERKRVADFVVVYENRPQTRAYTALDAKDLPTVLISHKFQKSLRTLEFLSNELREVPNKEVSNDSE